MGSFFKHTLFGIFQEGAVSTRRTRPYKVQGIVLSKRSAGALHFITFDLQNGKYPELCVTQQEIDTLHVGDRCELSFEGVHCTNIKQL
jgi:hypothetical protein